MIAFSNLFPGFFNYYLYRLYNANVWWLMCRLVKDALYQLQELLSAVYGDKIIVILVF